MCPDDRCKRLSNVIANQTVGSARQATPSAESAVRRNVLSIFENSCTMISHGSTSHKYQCYWAECLYWSAILNHGIQTKFSTPQFGYLQGSFRAPCRQCYTYFCSDQYNSEFKFCFFIAVIILSKVPERNVRYHNPSQNTGFPSLIYNVHVHMWHLEVSISVLCV